MSRPVILKLGGELLEDPSRLNTVVAAIAAAVGKGPLAVVHGGGREIDAALKTAGIEKRQVDGLRITDAATLDVVVAVLAGTVNTRFVAALNTAGVSAVGLTGADARCGLSVSAPPHRAVDGTTVELGRVGLPSPQSDRRLLDALLQSGFVPVIASVGIGIDGLLFNVNADTFAGHLAARLSARRLVIAGATPGVLNDKGETMAELDQAGIERLIAAGTATVGMIAKLRACSHAVSAGTEEVIVVDGRDQGVLESAVRGTGGNGAAKTTRVARAAAGKV